MSGALKCDGCGKFAATTVDKVRLARPASLPLGWLRIFIEDRARDEVTISDGSYAEVCSRACGATWLAGYES